jgi:hypothetical protein
MQKEMEKWTRFIVQKLKDAELFASQGGPVILTQVLHFPIYSRYLLNPLYWHHIYIIHAVIYPLHKYIRSRMSMGT